MKSYTLFTGSTGLIGQYVLRDLLLEQEQIAVIVRPSHRRAAEERIEAILQHWEREFGKQLSRPVCLAGDLSQPYCGLTSESRQWVRKNCDSMLHNAAVLVFQGLDKAGEPWKTNVEGTRTVLNLCRDLDISTMHYVSTAYVSGRREGVILEDELDMGQSFRNDYEESKFIAESMVRDANFFQHCTVYRPAVVSGDSVTGFTSTYHGLYLYLHLAALLAKKYQPDENGIIHIPFRVNSTGEEKRNIVPVDWISTVICDLFLNRKAWGKTFHLAPEQGITPKHIIESANRYLKVEGVVFVGPNGVPLDEMNSYERLAYEQMSVYEEYDHSDPTFDMTNLKTYSRYFQSPKIDELMIQRYVQFAEQDRWGRKKTQAPDVAVWAKDVLTDLIGRSIKNELCEQYGSHDLEHVNGQLNLNAYGPGGGQWSLYFDENRLVRYRDGMQLNSVPTVALETSELADFYVHVTANEKVDKP